jgi:16S rRNA (cytosine1402-N4)-methyltransferase
MIEEAMACLNCGPGKIYADCTVGGGGHSRAILEKMTAQGLLIGIDQDEDAVIHARKALAPWSGNVRIFHGNFDRLHDFFADAGIEGADGILADLGLSFYQIEGSGRGFSFQRDEPLDMRMDKNNGVTAEDLINGLREEELIQILWEYGEERWARRIGREIVQARKKARIRSSMDLARVVTRAVPVSAKRQPGRRLIHPATRTFMAIRIKVNRELERLESFMAQVPSLLNPGGRLCVISFHSLEDRVVKRAIKTWEKGCTCPKDIPQCVCGQKKMFRSLTRKPVIPSDLEIEMNPMARSAKLRAAEKL